MNKHYMDCVSKTNSVTYVQIYYIIRKELHGSEIFE
jgi:hypothetical protein